MIKKIIVFLTAILIVIPVIIIINLPDFIVGYYRIEDHFATNTIKPYSKQIEELENTEKSLRGLQAFVSEQKEKLIHSEKILQNLKGNTIN